MSILRTRHTIIAMTLALGATAACGSSTPALQIEALPVGAEVAVVRDDGGVVQGTLSERTTEAVKVDGESGVRAVLRKDIAEVQIIDPTAPVPVALPERARFLEYTLPAGTSLTVRLDTAVHSKSSRVEDLVEATLTDAVTQGDSTIVPVGSLLKGDITAVEASGKVKGRASLAMRFRTLTITGHDRPYDVVVGMSQLAPPTKSEDYAKIGIPTAVGGIVGGILGGKKGALAGIVIGGGAGTAVVLTTAGDDIDLPPGTTLTMTLDQPVEIRVPIIKG
jgi:hypothetical protein